MRRLIVILFLSLYSLGNIVSPYGDLSCLRDMYHHCACEDPDINVADFVFEHLLNLPVEYFEHEENEDEHERPHQPYHIVTSVMQVVVISKPIVFECKPSFEEPVVVTYPLTGQDQLPAGYISQIFHPPIV